DLGAHKHGSPHPSSYGALIKKAMAGCKCLVDCDQSTKARVKMMLLPLLIRRCCASTCRFLAVANEATALKIAGGAAMRLRCGGETSVSSRTPRFRHSSMERWNPGRHGCLRTHPREPGCRPSCRHDEALHFHVRQASASS